MPKIIKAFVLTKDIKNTDRRSRTGAFADMPDEFFEDDVFIREIIVPLEGKKNAYDAYTYLDDEGNPVFAFERGSTMYSKLEKALRRAKPSMGRLIHEYNAYLPETVTEIMQRLIDGGYVTLRQLEDVLMQYRRDNDYDMLEQDDTIMLPRKGHSKLDEDEGLTDPTRDDFDPDLEGYVEPNADGEDEDKDGDEYEDEEPPEGLPELADKIYEILCATPGKTRKLTTLMKLTGEKTAEKISTAMDYLFAQGLINEKGHAVTDKE